MGERTRRDGSYTAREGLKRADTLRKAIDRIDFTNLSRIDSISVLATLDLLNAIASRQDGYTPTPAHRPQPWPTARRELPPAPTIRLCCDHTWPTKRPCDAYGAPGPHGCELAPGHTGHHVCPCGSGSRQRTDHQ